MASILTRESFLSQKFTAEDRFTSAVNMYVSHNYEQLRGFYFHIPNESATSNMMRIKLFSMGVIPGIPDFCFMLPYVWYLELKIASGKLSPAQQTLHKRWRDKGIVIHTAWSPEQVVSILEGVVGKPKFVK